MPEDVAPVVVPGERLEQFVDAQKTILDIQPQHTSKLESADDLQQSEQLRQQANKAMVVAVEEAGLNVESYNQIAMAVRSDPELQQQINDMNGSIQQAQWRPPGSVWRLFCEHAALRA